jgi:L-seryl-tRNA(Ser) seleniumtransferase
MAQKEVKNLRQFPSVEQLLQSPEISASIDGLPRQLAVELVRQSVNDLKRKVKSQKRSVSRIELVERAGSLLESWKHKELQKVINATGIVVHTNLGRAPLGKELISQISESISAYNNLELDLQTGKRGNRGEACEKYLAILCGAESATTVNNCAAALFIILNTFAQKKCVLLSRGELVQIGGGFRIPDILKRSGAKLTEIGATNITNLKDYSEAIDNSTSLILKVHKSNFVQAGFTKEVELSRLATVASKNSLILVHDLGSGAVFQTKKLLGHEEPTPHQSIRNGADIVCFSGDKMLGGVQAGLIAGKKDLIDQIKKNPLFRTVRLDKIILAALEKILKSYLNGTHTTDIKLWKLLSVSEGDLYKRAKKITASLDNPEFISVEATKSYIGGGGLPESALPSVGLIFSKKLNPEDLQTAFRKSSPPIIGRIENDRFILDLKAIDENDLELLEIAIKQVLRNFQK